MGGCIRFLHYYTVQYIVGLFDYRWWGGVYTIVDETYRSNAVTYCTDKIVEYLLNSVLDADTVPARRSVLL